MKIFAITFTAVLLLAGCSSEDEKKQTYDKKLSGNLIQIFEASENKDTEKAMNILETMDDKKRFVHDFKLNIKDQEILESSLELCQGNRFSDAEELINNRISQRGMTPTLEHALLSIQTSMRIINFNKQATLLEKSLKGQADDTVILFKDSSDAFRELAIIKRDGDQSFGADNNFTQWWKNSLTRVKNAEKLEKKLIGQSLSLHRDIAYITDSLTYQAADIQLQVVDTNHPYISSWNNYLQKGPLNRPDYFSDDIPASISYTDFKNEHYKTAARLLLTQKAGDFSGILQRIRVLARDGRLSEAVIMLEELNQKMRVDTKQQQQIISTILQKSDNRISQQLEQAYIDFPSLLSIIEKLQKK